MPTFLIPANNPPPIARVPRGVNALTRPSMAFTPVVPRSTKNFTKSDSTSVDDKCSAADSNDFILSYIQPDSQNLVSC